jgi:hypothetical protein
MRELDLVNHHHFGWRTLKTIRLMRKEVTVRNEIVPVIVEIPMAMGGWPEFIERRSMQKNAVTQGHR